MVSTEQRECAKCIVKLDFENAFNTLSRDFMLQRLRETFPGLARFAYWCYRNDSNLLFHSKILKSAAGVQQGDPLGPLIFSTAIHDMVTRCKSLEVGGRKLDVCAFYLDDGVIAGDMDVVSAVVQHVVANAAAMGLRLNVGKCELILPTAVTDVDLSTLFPAALLVDTATGAPRTNITGDFELLGAAIGCADFCTEYANAKVNKASELLAKIAKLDDPQVSVRLLQRCAGVCKITHSMRLTPPDLHADALRRFDVNVRSCFSASTGTMPNQAQWDQACRGVGQAGFGLGSAELHKEAAFLSSACSSRALCHAIDGSFVLGGAIASSDFGRALAAYNSLLPPGQHAAPDAISGSSQKALSKAVNEVGHGKRLAEASLVDRATLLSECEDGAKQFWTMVPSVTAGLAVPPAEFVVELKFRRCMLDGDAT